MTIKEIYAMLVLQCGISPDYVLDKMEFYEIECLIENMWMRNKDSWEQTRTVAYVTAQCQSTKKLDPQEMMTFPWEKNQEEAVDTPEEREQIRKEMKEMERRMNKNKKRNINGQ